MFLLWLYLSINIANQPLTCSLEKDGGKQVKIKIEKYHSNLTVLSEDAKVESCKKVENFDGLYAARIFLGKAGTTKEAQATHLFVYKASKDGLEKLFEYPVSVKEIYVDLKSGKTEKSEISYEIKLEKNSKGDLVVNVDNGRETFVVESTLLR